MDCMQSQFINGVLLHGRYKTICALNHGSFGLVFKAEDVTTGDLVALKCLTKTSAATAATTTFAIDERSEELAIHRIIGSHPNIVNLVDNFETENHIYLVLEYCPHGDLYEAIRLGRGPGQTETIREAMLQLIDAIEYMHACNVFHRDIKPENIFLSASGSIKLGDFGLACRDEVSYEAAVGSDRYMAPEQMDNDGNGYSPAKADVWAIGICLLNILFSRNPFATPTLSDPLFSDFAADRQTLFDVFPNMSQDTFDILVHSLAIDPEYRSLAAVREAVEKAVLFTTDDESLDEFCAAPATIATANREPLRTPSISSPQVDQGTTFPWAKALALTSPARQLSVIEDVDLVDESFDVKGSYDKYYQAQPDNASVVSFVDSGLGVSIQSNLESDHKMTKSKPVPISGSLPVTAARPIPSLAAVFGKKSEFQSKSWSDLWDEEFEEENNDQSDDEPEMFGRQSMDSLLSVSHGSNTPRAALADLKAEEVSNSFARTPESVIKAEDYVSQDTGFIFEDHTDSPAAHTPTPLSDSRYSPPSKRSIVDKWAALGSRRRAYPTPVKTPGRSISYATTTPITISTTPQKRARQSSGRKGLNWTIWGQSQQGQNEFSSSLSPVANKKEWDMTRDWRQHDKSLHNSHMEAHRGRPLEWVWRM